MKNVNKRKQNFVFGAMLLMISGILCKLIGAFFKVPLTNMIGDDGMGYFSAAYSIYTILFTVSTAGIPVAVSRIISSYIVKKDKKSVANTFRISFIILFILGIAGSAVMLIFAPWLAKNVLSNEKSVYATRALAPALFFICLESALRGYFQGHQNMTPTSISQVIESLCKLGIGIGAAMYAMNIGYSIEMVAAFAIVGISIGGALSCLYLIIAKLTYKNYDYGIIDESYTPPTSDYILKEIAVIAIPITLSSLVLSIINPIDSTMITRCLQNGGLTIEKAMQVVGNTDATLSNSEIIEKAANILYGNYSALAVTMFNLPLVLLTPLSISIIPVLSEAFTQNDRTKINEITDSAFRIQSAVSLPCTAGLCALSFPVLRVLYKASSAKMAAPLLSILSISIFFIALVSVTNAMLQSLHKQWLPIISMSAGVVVKFVSAAVLMSIPSINIYGAPISTVLCYFTAMIFNFVFMAKYAKCVPGIRKVFVRPLICAIICGICAFISYSLISNLVGTGRIVTIICIAFAAIVYFISIFALKALTKEDILLLPKGNKIYSLLCKLKLVRK